jgi:hypothetical protein
MMRFYLIASRIWAYTRKNQGVVKRMLLLMRVKCLGYVGIQNAPMSMSPKMGDCSLKEKTMEMQKNVLRLVANCVSLLAYGMRWHLLMPHSSGFARIVSCT